LRIEAVDRIGKRGPEKAGAPLGNHRATLGRVKDNFDTPRGAVRFEADNGVDRTRETRAESGDGGASTFADALGNFRMV
jgi:hypothetical protein